MIFCIQSSVSRQHPVTECLLMHCFHSLCNRKYQLKACSYLRLHGFKTRLTQRSFILAIKTSYGIPLIKCYGQIWLSQCKDIRTSTESQREKLTEVFHVNLEAACSNQTCVWKYEKKEGANHILSRMGRIFLSFGFFPIFLAFWELKFETLLIYNVIELEK